MKKITALMLAVVMMFSLAGCKAEEKASFESAVDLLTAAYEEYDEEERFPICGGDMDQSVMDAPGKFDIEKVEELDLTLGLPKSAAEDIDDAASIVHLMNANIFTGAAYHLKSGVDAGEFAEEIKGNLMERQWICGSPEILFVIDSGDGYVISLFGETTIARSFKDNVLGLFQDGEVLVEETIE